MHVQKKHVPLPEELDARLKAFRRDDDDNDDGGLQELAVRRKMPQNPPPVPHASAAARVRHIEFYRSTWPSLSLLMRHCIEHDHMKE